ncbi:hypothetical protein [Marinobacter sp.]|uniref:hypothetical protein n=1 Tax=Marinobacter sp. TaxID=50741 RepID=UPI003B51999E
MQCALIYDFDGTLAKGNCAEHGLMPALGLNEHSDFWPEVNRKNRERDGDEILTYLGELAKRARDEGKQGDRTVPFDHMIYFGDGDTDIPAMKMVKAQGGCSLAVFDGDKWGQGKTQEKIEKLISEERANYVVQGDYTSGSQLDVTVRGILRLYKRRHGQP